MKERRVHIRESLFDEQKSSHFDNVLLENFSKLDPVGPLARHRHVPVQLVEGVHQTFPIARIRLRIDEESYEFGISVLKQRVNKAV